MKISEHISSASTLQKCAYQNCKKCEKFPASSDNWDGLMDAYARGP